MYQIREPQNKKEFEAYYNVRWEILRKPWDKPIGSEKDDLEDTSFHAIAVNLNKIIGVARLHFNSADEAQIRYMAVDEKYRKSHIGSALLKYLEEKALENNAETIVLNAREEAVHFYLKNRYKNVGKSYLMWDIIQHYKMMKSL